MLLSWKEWREKQEKQEKDPQENNACSAESPKECQVLVGFDPGRCEDVCSNNIAQINNATEQSLLEIKGIGPKTVEKIISARPFTSFDGLPVSESVRGKLEIWTSSAT